MTTTVTQPKLEKLTIEIHCDTNPDTSTIGEYTDEAQPWAIVRTGEHRGRFIADLGEDDELPDKGREYRFFVPYAGGEKEGGNHYREYGKQDFERMESLQAGNWQFVGILAKGETSRDCGQGCRRLQSLTSGGLWGIESDSGAQYLESVMRDELDDLRTHLESFNVDCSGFDELAATAISNPVNR